MNTVTVSLAAGEVLLERLLQEGVAVAHDCGGNLACTSCRVVVRDGMQHLSAASEEELDRLDRAPAHAPGARLACQAVSHDGGEVLIALAESTVPARVAGSSSPVSMSERAAAFLAAQLSKHPAAVAVRLAVEPAGCSGFGYRIHPTDSIREDDRVFEAGGVRIVVDVLSLPYLQGAALDLVQEGLARRLRFDNPNAHQSCGCGESFGV
jgi:iron-sulfur cluster assembly protein